MDVAAEGVVWAGRAISGLTTLVFVISASMN